MSSQGLVRVIRAADCRRMPWKNGGGETVEIACHPADSSLDSFAWRLSTARVEQDGPFSSFPDIDRTLTILDGGGMDLRIGDAAPITINAASEPLTFPADQPTEARLLAGPITDLNVMTRRGISHCVRRLTVEGGSRLAARADTVLLFCAAGDLLLADGSRLAAGDCAILQTADVGIDQAVEGNASAVVIEITHPA